MRTSRGHPNLSFSPIPGTWCYINQIFLKYCNQCSRWDDPLNLSDCMVHFLFWSISIEINTHITFFLRYIPPYHISPGQWYVNIAYYFCFKSFFKTNRTYFWKISTFLFIYSWLNEQESYFQVFLFYFSRYNASFKKEI